MFRPGARGGHGGLPFAVTCCRFNRASREISDLPQTLNQLPVRQNTVGRLGFHSLPPTEAYREQSGEKRLGEGRAQGGGGVDAGVVSWIIEYPIGWAWHNRVGAGSSQHISSQ
ncbi:hypothetical protein RRG08_011280 [Elysia crispata]|uniref:Uncharacterized protein n=1 Tax=Elysia crispata TaxID=231223 RepID=A0AAE0ZMQ5_9GAST|nr:hypothetical protein RRG08_011280 [Elysia crispata]